MQPEQWQKIETVFFAALPLPSSAWDTFVSDQCAGDEELSGRILALLNEDENGTLDLLDDSFFELGARLITAEDELIDGQDFGPYRIERLLGRGGMGTVYLAEDSRLNRQVALKVLPSAFVDGSSAVKRFHREARAASQINHENVAHIYEFGSIDERYFIAMEYVPGQTLRELIKEGQIDRTRAIDYALQVATALAAAHGKSVIHRDIKPENIAIRDDGVVKVLDFGLAQQKASLDKPGSLSGILMGTTSYMSPEQVRAQDLDERTDIWSLGVVLYEMLSGTRPFYGETPTELHAAILADDLPSQKLNERYKKVYRVAEKCLQKERSERYLTAESLIEDLESVGAKLPSGWSKRFWVAAILLGAIIATAGAIWFFGIGTARPALAGPIESIAVMPFVNDGGTTEKEYLVDGMAETLAASISQVQGLTVKARSSVFKYKGQEIDAVSAGRDLAVQAVLLGRMSESDGQIDLSLSLVDVASGRPLWSQEYKRSASEIISLQKQVALDVSNELNRRLSGDEKRRLAKVSTTNPEAFDNYLMGRFYWNKRTGKDIKRSIERFQEAIKIDPDFALAYAGLADSQLLLSSYAGVPPSESFPKAKASALKALELDDSLAEAHTTLAYELFSYDWNFDESDKQMARAIELNPNYATAYHWYGNGSLLATGRFDESIEAMKHARRLDPLSLIINADLGTSYLYALRLDEAIAQFQKTLEMDGNFYYAHVYLGRAYLLRGDYEKAIDELQTADKIEKDPRIPMLFSRVYSKMGRRADALRQLDELKKMSATQYISNFDYALVYTGLGNNDRAFEYLEKGYRNHDGNMVYIKADPLLAELRTDPRYFDLARRIGLEK